MTVRLDRRRRPDVADRRARRPTLEPVKTDGYDVQVSRGRRASRRTASTSSSAADDPATSSSRRPRPSSPRSSRQPRPRQPQERPGQGDARDPGHRRSEQGDRRRPRPRPRSPARSAPRSSRQTATAGHVRADGQPVDLVVQLDPDADDRRSRTSQALPVGHGGQGAARRRSRPSSRSTSRAASPGSTRPRPRRSPAEITSDDTGAVSQAVQADDRRARGRRDDPGRRDRRARRRHASSRPRRSAACSPRWASPILLVYVMMVLTFNSLITPFIILFSLPLALDRRLPGAATSPTGRSASAPSSGS